MAIVAAVLGLVARLAGQVYCHPVTDPVQSVAGASYCRTVADPYSWIAYPAAALALAFIVRWLWPKRHARRLALLAVSVAVIAATAWVFSLPATVD